MLGSNLHAFTEFIFLIVRVINTNDVHSGVEILWSPMRFPPFSTSSSYHNFHHAKDSANSYASYTFIWDHLTGSADNYHKYIYKLE